MPTSASTPSSWQIPDAGRAATLACLWEVSAPKPGNVHRGADFEDMTFGDFVVSAWAVGPALAVAADQRLGAVVLSAVQATRQVVNVNTNLGTILLLAPLAMARPSEPLDAAVRRILAELDAEDCRLTYEAIRLAQPGGMGRVDDGDLAGPPPNDLLAAMRWAAGRDRIAWLYAEGFAPLFEVAIPCLVAGLQRGWSLTEAIVRLHLELMSRWPDTLIARKCGPETAQRSADHARSVLDAGEPGDDDYAEALADLDFWLRADHHRRNPGTTADLVAATLFTALRTGLIAPPWRI